MCPCPSRSSRAKSCSAPASMGCNRWPAMCPGSMWSPCGEVPTPPRRFAVSLIPVPAVIRWAFSWTECCKPMCPVTMRRCLISSASKWSKVRKARSMETALLPARSISSRAVPRPNCKARRTLSAGSDAYRAIFASVSGPLGPPGLLGRASFADREFGGTGVNVANPRENLNGYQIWGASLALEYSWATDWRVSGNVRLTNDQQRPARDLDAVRERL